MWMHHRIAPSKTLYCASRLMFLTAAEILSGDPLSKLYNSIKSLSMLGSPITTAKEIAIIFFQSQDFSHHRSPSSTTYMHTQWSDFFCRLAIKWKTFGRQHPPCNCSIFDSFAFMPLSHIMWYFRSETTHKQGKIVDDKQHQTHFVRHEWV